MAAGAVMSDDRPGRRESATAVVLRGGSVLLVREAGVPYYSLPGGGVHEGESAAAAAAREVREELGLAALRVERLEECDHAGFMNDHRVCLVEASPGEPRLAGHELDGFCWWDRTEPLALHPHVTAILSNMARAGRMGP